LPSAGGVGANRHIRIFGRFFKMRPTLNDPLVSRDVRPSSSRPASRVTSRRRLFAGRSRVFGFARRAHGSFWAVVWTTDSPGYSGVAHRNPPPVSTFRRCPSEEIWFWTFPGHGARPVSVENTGRGVPAERVGSEYFIIITRARTHAVVHAARLGHTRVRAYSRRTCNNKYRITVVVVVVLLLVLLLVIVRTASLL